MVTGRCIPGPFHAWSQSPSIHTLLLSIIFCQMEPKKDIGKIFRGDSWVGSINARKKRQHVNPRNQLWVPSEWWCDSYRLSSENCQHLAILQRKWSQGRVQKRASEPHRTFLPKEGTESVQERVINYADCHWGTESEDREMGLVTGKRS